MFYERKAKKGHGESVQSQGQILILGGFTRIYRGFGGFFLT